METPTTQFLPAQRASSETVARQSGEVAELPFLAGFMEVVPELVIILNEQRQIVYANKTALDFLRTRGGIAQLGLRPGEALRCARAAAAPGGCGTSEFCRTCGAPKAILAAMQSLQGVEECRIIQAGTDAAFDLLISTGPVEWRGQHYVLAVLRDISDQKRRRMLERIFFHDVLNTAGGLQGLIELFPGLRPGEHADNFPLLQRLSTTLVDEIVAQRELLSAEENELQSRPARTEALAVLNETAAAYRAHHCGHDRRIDIAPDSRDCVLWTDPGLLKRVLGNLVKNALEASKPGETVTLRCVRRGEEAEFTVHNPGCMPREVQLQVFQRSFSTKGADRGLGTHSAKLLTERYLGGRLTFASAPETGTTFMALYPVGVSAALAEERVCLGVS